MLLSSLFRRPTPALIPQFPLAMRRHQGTAQRPHNGGNNSASAPPPLQRVESILTSDITRLNQEEKATIIRELNDSFKHATLDNTLFYRSLMEGNPLQTHGNFADNRLVSMVNSHPVIQKRLRLQHVFRQLSAGETVTPPPASGQAQQQQQGTPRAELPRDFSGSPYGNNNNPENLAALVQNHIASIIAGGNSAPPTTPGAPVLASLIPEAEKHAFSRAFLEKLTMSRFESLAEYLNEVRVTAKRHPRLQNTASFDNMKNILTVMNDQTKVKFSIDIEAHENNQKNVTEIGISIYDPALDAVSLYPHFRNIHILPHENIRLRNGAYVADNKDKFLGGPSIILPMKECTKLIQCLVDHYFTQRQDLGAVIVGHNVPGDIAWLKNMGVKFPKTPTVVDTATLYGFSYGQNNSSLGAILRRFDIPHSYLHNAGNDAYFTLVLAMKMSSPQFRRLHKMDDPVDAYEEVLQARSETTAPNPFDETKPSRSRGKKAAKNNETLAPLKFNNASAALRSVFKS